MLLEDFRAPPQRRWRTTAVGRGHLAILPHGLRLLTVGASQRAYSDAQIDDYAQLRRRDFPWRPPLTLTLRARASGPLLGTAGFGFWNNPFSPLGGTPALPSALWFFHASPPSDLPLAQGVPGQGWKCAALDATTARAIRWAALAPAAMLLCRWPRLRQRIWPPIQRDLAISEHPMATPDRAWRTYRIQWGLRSARFLCDGQLLHQTDQAPRGPLGFVAWVDNQWAVATPWGRFGWGLLDAAAPQWLDLASIHIQTHDRQPWHSSCS